MLTDVDDEPDDAQPHGEELEELRDSDFPGYFSERDNRLYQVDTATSPYPLPIDTPENKRVRALHKMLKQLIAGNYIGPVAEVLAPREGQQKVAIDLGCGTGDWIMEMAKDFPHVSFHGLDIVPIATRYPDANVQFELHDIGEPMRWANGSVNLIHARSIFMTVRDYSVIVQESARMLKPGGMYLSGEWGQFPAFHPHFPQAEGHPGVHVPGLDRFYRMLRDVLALRGIISPVASTVDQRLRNSGSFTDIQEHIFYMPIGSWADDPMHQTLGKRNRLAQTNFMNSIRPIFVAAGVTQRDLEQLYNECWTEMYGASGLVSIYYLVSACRI
ncbi:S-adenosyl-L-methionine-dependent methyltransferase [Lentinula aciculospora]|uniref:S-adenosyl-L-methionine-dependent methyltransferase n=1 Tax=Lentinula aciculospora TaxID=153920 RepID=A0A9W9DQ28_9AGAR|nr:S-adenosyl-L-methionine-dependent methyltransferase [Lentinula aciculospora]